MGGLANAVWCPSHFWDKAEPGGDRKCLCTPPPRASSAWSKVGIQPGGAPWGISGIHSTALCLRSGPEACRRPPQGARILLVESHCSHDDGERFQRDQQVQGRDPGDSVSC